MAVPATAYSVGPPSSLAHVAEHLDVPEGYRVEIVDGNIIVSPAPLGHHARIVRHLENALRPVLPAGVLDTQQVTVQVAWTGEQYVPDLVVLPEEALPDDAWLFSAEACLLTVEVTSPSNSEIDRLKKPRGYAVAGIPMYLLVDAVVETVTLFRDPSNGVYRAHETVPFGNKIHLPAPFDVTIDTAEFS